MHGSLITDDDAECTKDIRGRLAKGLGKAQEDLAESRHTYFYKIRLTKALVWL